MTTTIVRFAPSPTGSLHIGSVRTALFNWLYARHHGGKFLLRIEDTDKLRSTQENTDSIFEILNWLGIDYDDTPVIQSTRLERHAEVAHRLIDSGNAYKCYCTTDELATKKEAAIKNGDSYKYDRKCRENTDGKNLPYVIRVKSEIFGATVVDDMVQGSVKVENSQLDDIILLRSDGTPTYMLSVVVDDHDMSVTHVIRGDDHLTNTFRQIQIYKACGWNIPKFAHIPLIYGPDGAKLSKRHGAVSASEYRDLGYLPEAICNYLLRLGWSHGDSEIISREEAIEWFTFDNVGKSPSRFDTQKLNHLNAHYIKKADNERLFNLINDNRIDRSMALRGMDSLKERADTINNLAKSALIYNTDNFPNSYDEKCHKFATSVHLRMLRNFVDTEQDYAEDVLLNTAKNIAVQENVKLVEIAQALRSAITGSTTSPSVFEIMAILGKKESVNRINRYIQQSA